MIVGAEGDGYKLRKKVTEEKERSAKRKQKNRNRETLGHLRLCKQRNDFP